MTAIVAFLVAAGTVTLFPGEKTVTPQQIVKGKITGKVVVEFPVGASGKLLTGRATLIDESEPLQIEPRNNAGGGARLYVIVTWEAATRLKRLGIENPAQHFEGKIVRVTGSVERKMDSPGLDFYELTVTSLDQIESIRNE